MKIATYNVNGVNGRLPVLLRWLAESKPDIVCLQELKAPQDKFPEKAISDAGYKAIWHGQKSWNGVAILSRTEEIKEVTRTLPGNPDDLQSRYLEAIVGKILVVCLYVPNGNPAPGPKLDYKLDWLNRFSKRAKVLLDFEMPIVLAGDYNVIPTERDVYKPERWINDALFRVEVRAVFEEILEQGWTDAIRELHPSGNHLYVLGLFQECLWPERRNAHRSFFAQQQHERKAHGNRSKYRSARLGKEQRSRAGLDSNRKPVKKSIKKAPRCGALFFGLS